MRSQLSASRSICTMAASHHFSLSAQEPHQHHDVDEKLGTVSFATSCLHGSAANSSRWRSPVCTPSSTSRPTRIRGGAKRSAPARWLTGHADLLPGLWNRTYQKADLAQGAELLAERALFKPADHRELDYIRGASVFYLTPTSSTTISARRLRQGDARASTNASPNDRRSLRLLPLALAASVPTQPQSHQRHSRRRHPTPSSTTIHESSRHRAYIIHTVTIFVASRRLHAARNMPASRRLRLTRQHAFAHLLRAPRSFGGTTSNSNLVPFGRDGMAEHHHVNGTTKCIPWITRIPYANWAIDPAPKRNHRSRSKRFAPKMDHDLRLIYCSPCGGPAKYALERRHGKA